MLQTVKRMTLSEFETWLKHLLHECSCLPYRKNDLRKVTLFHLNIISLGKYSLNSLVSVITPLKFLIATPADDYLLTNGQSTGNFRFHNKMFPECWQLVTYDRDG